MNAHTRRFATIARSAGYAALLLLPVILAACGKGGSARPSPGAAGAARW